MFPLKNLVAFAKNKLPYLSDFAYNGSDVMFLKNLQKVLVKDGYGDWIKVEKENVDQIAHDFSNLILDKCEKHLNFNNTNAFYPSVMIREISEQNAWKYCNYRTKGSPFTGKATYNIHMAIICYCISHLRFTTLKDLNWESWDSIE